MAKMSIHRGLAELKTIDSRIEKLIHQIKPTGIMQKGKLVNNYYTKEDFEKNARAKFQAVNDLISRKNQIKSAITKANVTTQVEISGKKMTIADAINYKSIADSLKYLISDLESKHRKAKTLTEQNNAKISENALLLAKEALQKDNVKINEGDAVAITEPYIERNEFKLVDALKVEDLIEGIQKDIDNFETEVDATLSEINAITQIEI